MCCGWFSIFFVVCFHMDVSVSFRATPNIALVKYWGKRNKELNLPVNSSLSVTLRDVWKSSRI